MSSTEGKSIKCRAAICWGVDKPLTVETVEVAPPKKGEVRVRIVASGLCASDNHVVTGHHFGWTFKFPCILGHEGAGVIESVGEDVVGLAPGDHVVALYLQQCRDCALCQSDLTNFCLNYDLRQHYFMNDGTSRYTLDGQVVYRFLAATFSEYAVLSANAVAKISPELPLDKVCLIGCGVGTGYGSAINLADVRPGTSCAIWGLGAIGLAAAMGCKSRQPRKLIGVDINEEKFEMCKSFGFTEFVNPNKLNEPIATFLQKQGGVDFAFECVGTLNTVKQAFDSLSPFGTCVIVGVQQPDEVPVALGKMLTGQTITSGLYGGYKSVDGATSLVKKYADGELDLDSLITHKVNLDQINEAFDMLRKGKCIRTVIYLQ